MKTKFASLIGGEGAILLNMIYNRYATMTIPDPDMMELDFGEGTVVVVEIAPNGTFVVSWNGGEEFAEFDNFKDTIEFCWSEKFV